MSRSDASDYGIRNSHYIISEVVNIFISLRVTIKYFKYLVIEICITVTIKTDA